MSTPAGGLVLVDKERGPSSHAVVRRVGRLHGLKAGHAGTLDPFATGLLVCLVGRATRLARYLVGLDKRYLATIRLGLRTTTGDAEGDELEETEVATREAIAALRGDIELRVPAASAIKIGGRRAYELHRRGVAVEMPTRRSTVHGVEILSYDPPEAVVALHVSSGTYVRALADALGGHCVELRRAAVGALTVEEADEERLRPALDALQHLPRLEVAADERIRAATGGELTVAADDGPLALVHDGDLVAVAQVADGRARPETVLA